MTSFDRERYRTRTATKNTQPDNFEFVLCTVHSGRVQGSEYCVVHSAQYESTGVRQSFLITIQLIATFVKNVG